MGNKSIISAGRLLHKMLRADPDVSQRATAIFPVICRDDARLPYISYSRLDLDNSPTATTFPALTGTFEVNVYAADYEGGVELAEAVFSALDGKCFRADGLTMRSCTFSDGEEGWQDGAFIQRMIFTVKI